MFCPFQQLYLCMLNLRVSLGTYPRVYTPCQQREHNRKGPESDCGDTMTYEENR